MASSPTSDPEKKVLDDSNSDDAVLAQLGYTQELKRSFGLLGMVGFSFSIVTSWTALSGVLIIGVESGGPPVMIWGWLAVCLVTLAVAYSMAEMCSAYPVAGGQYSWVAILAPSRVARPFSYVCGWFMLIGIICMGAVNNFVATNFVLGIAQLNYGFTIERWHTVLVAYLITILAATSNTFLPHILNKLSKAIFAWNLLSFVICLVTILTTNKNKQSAKYVFSDFQNFTGWNAPYTACLGILQGAFGMCCYDAPSHMTEEIKNARKQAPRAIIMSVYIGFFTGFVWLIALCFCIGDLESTGATPTGVPVIEIIFNSTGNIAGASTLSSMIAIIAIVSANSLMAEGSRAVYAFARDNGLPFSEQLSKVSSRSVPVYAIVLTAIVQMAFNSIYFGTTTGFNTIIAIATQGFYLSYLMPLFSRILAHITGKKTRLEGPYSLGKWGIVLNVIGFIYLAFICIIANFPTATPVDSENMNYTSAATGLVMLVSLIFWITTGRKKFTGPADGTGLPSLQDPLDDVEVREARLQNKLETALVQIRNLGEQRDNAQQAESVARSAFNAIHAEWNTYHEKASMADSQRIVTLEREAEEAKQKKDELENQIQNLKDEKDANTEKIEKLQDEVKQLEETVQDRADQLREVREKLVATEREHSDTKNDYEKTIKHLKEQREQLQDSVEKLRGDVEHEKATAAHIESTLNRAYADLQNVRDARLAVVRAKDELEAQKLDLELLNEDLHKQWEEENTRVKELESQLEEIHALSIQNENFQADIERLTDMLAEHNRTIIVKDERIAHLEGQYQKERQRNLNAAEAADAAPPMSPFDEAPPSLFSHAGESLAAELDAASDQYDMFDDEEEEEELREISDIAEVFAISPIEPAPYPELTIGVNETASYSPIEAAPPSLTLHFNEVGNVIPIKPAPPSELTIGMSETASVLPEEVVMPNFTLNFSEVGSVLPIKPASPPELTIGVSETASVAPEEVVVPNLTLNFSEVGSVTPVDAVRDNLTIGISETASSLPREAAPPKLTFNFNEIGSVASIEPASPPNLSINVDETASISPMEAAPPRLTLTHNEVGSVTPLEPAPPPEFVINVSETASIAPEEIVTPNLTLNFNEVGSVTPVDAVRDSLTIGISETASSSPMEAAPPNLTFHFNEVGSVASIEPASPPNLSINVDETASISPMEAAPPELTLSLNEVGSVVPVEPASSPSLTIGVNESANISPVESVSPKLSLTLNEVGSVAPMEPASRPDLIISVNETANISPAEIAIPKLSFSVNEVGNVTSVERKINTTSTSIQTNAQDLTTEMVHAATFTISPTTPVDIVSTTTSSQTELPKLTSVVVDNASIAVTPMEVEGLRPTVPAFDITIAPIMVTHEVAPLETSPPEISTMSTSMQTSATPEKPVSAHTAPVVLAPKPNKIGFLQSILPLLAALLAFSCFMLYTEVQAWRTANGVGFGYGRGGTNDRSGAFGNGRYLFGVIPLAMDVGGSWWSEQFARYVSMGITSFEEWAGISYVPLY